MSYGAAVIIIERLVQNASNFSTKRSSSFTKKRYKILLQTAAVFDASMLL